MPQRKRAGPISLATRAFERLPRPNEPDTGICDRHRAQPPPETNFAIRERTSLRYYARMIFTPDNTDRRLRSTDPTTDGLPTVRIERARRADPTPTPYRSATLSKFCGHRARTHLRLQRTSEPSAGQCLVHRTFASRSKFSETARFLFYLSLWTIQFSHILGHLFTKIAHLIVCKPYFS